MDIEWVWIFRSKIWILFKSSDHITLATYAMNLAPYSSANRFFLNMVSVMTIHHCYGCIQYGHCRHMYRHFNRFRNLGFSPLKPWGLTHDIILFDLGA
ncbi:hypothetical protein Hanom_Chr03g00257961 [Helianthus anomalus]